MSIQTCQLDDLFFLLAACIEVECFDSNGQQSQLANFMTGQYIDVWILLRVLAKKLGVRVDLCVHETYELVGVDVDYLLGLVWLHHVDHADLVVVLLSIVG